MKKPEGGTLGALKRFPVRTRLLEEIPRADDVGLDEVGRTDDRAVDVAFGREVNDGARPMALQRLLEKRPVADVPAREHVPAVAAQRVEVAQVAGIGELVQVDD